MSNRGMGKPVATNGGARTYLAPFPQPNGAGAGIGSVNVGYGNLVRPERIIAILEAKSLPVKRLRDRAVEENRLIDATAGRKMRSLIVIDSGHVVLSALSPQALDDRLTPSRNHTGPEEREFVS